MLVKISMARQRGALAAVLMMALCASHATADILFGPVAFSWSPESRHKTLTTRSAVVGEGKVRR